MTSNEQRGLDAGTIICSSHKEIWQARIWMEPEQRWSNWITSPYGYSWAYDEKLKAVGKVEERYLHAPVDAALSSATPEKQP